MVSVGFLFTFSQHSQALYPSKGLSWVASVGQWLIRRILIMPRMKCGCPYSASTAMIGHAPSVERLYPTFGKHELQSSLCEAFPLIWLWQWAGRHFPELRGCFH